tara:strand:+ start:799 stop:1884 length:1086 start_codon:yes stop_codon:yes gene_type:complete
MNRFVKITKQKVSQKFIGDLDVFNSIAEYIDSNIAFCVCGPPGCGKSHMVNMLLSGKETIEATTWTETECHIVIDETRIDKNILEEVKKFGKLSRLSTILITQDSSGIDFCPIVNVPKATPADMIKIAGKGSEQLNLAILCDGNIRNFLNALEFKTLPDNFTEPKELVKNLLCGQLQSQESDPWSLLSRGISDHGYMWSIVHENAIDSPNWDHNTAEAMSLADIYDGVLFSGNWDFMRYFTLEAFIHPSLQINHTLVRSKMRAGSSWTKFNNQKMRKKKVQNMDLEIDRIHTIKEMCLLKSDGYLETLKHYNITRQDLDIINHLALTRKIKPKDLTNLKKQIQDMGDILVPEVIRGTRCPD